MEATLAGALRLSDLTFEQSVLKSDKPVLVDFTATWCGPCHAMDPMIDELANEYRGKAVITKVDIDESPETAINFGIRSAPTLLFFKGGEVVDQMIGAAGKEKIKAKLAGLL